MKTNLSMIRIAAKGFSQIMLQNNVSTGICFLIGIAIGSVYMAIAAILSVIVGNATAMLFKYNKQDVQTGLYGYNAALVGVALTFIFQPTYPLWLLIIVGSSLTSVVQNLMMKCKIPPFTFPFIIVTWIILILVPHLSLPIEHANNGAAFISSDLQLLTNSIGQVIFQSNVWSGVFFFIGIIIARPLAFIYILAAIAISTLLGTFLQGTEQDILLGLWSYNAVLCAITFTGASKKNKVWAFISIVLSVGIFFMMQYYSIPALTFPFVAASWIAILIQKLFTKSLKTL